MPMGRIVMGRRVPTIARRFLYALIAVATAMSGVAGAQSGNPQADQPTDQTQSQAAGSSSSQTTHRKTGTYSNETIRHTRVLDDSGTPPELTRAEDLIQKHDYTNAAPLLQKVAEADPKNYVAWFDLGFTENGLGNSAESIAAYRKSVAAKPDVFESNLNLGLQLAKTG